MNRGSLMRSNLLCCLLLFRPQLTRLKIPTCMTK